MSDCFTRHSRAQAARGRHRSPQLHPCCPLRRHLDTHVRSDDTAHATDPHVKDDLNMKVAMETGRYSRAPLVGPVALFALAAWALIVPARAQQVTTDPDFDLSVHRPTYVRSHPRVVYDEAHHNLHTMEGRYRPLAELLEHDGYDIVPGQVAFSLTTLQAAAVLLVSNARSSDGPPTDSDPAFPARECDAVQQWVHRGGSLLLIADHAPFGRAAHELGIRFGIRMDPGFVFDPHNSQGDPTFLVFSHENGLLGEHPVIRGRDPSERVEHVVAFTGQSLSVPPGATALLPFSPSAREADTYAESGRR
jgi:hypothetical protein